MKKKVYKDYSDAQKRILKWRKEGPARFAVDALGMPEKWDSIKKVGVMPWWWEASDKLVKTRRISIRSGHGVGKSAFIAISILWFSVCYFPTKIPCTAPTAHQLSDVLWAELAKWLRVLETKMPSLGEQFEWTQDEFRLRAAPKESFAAARTARADKPEALQGMHSENLLIVADEASGIPDIVFEVGQGAMSTEGSFAILAANPTRRSGMFYETHHSLRERWATIVVNGEDCPMVSQQFIDDIAFQYGKDSNVYRVRVQGEFPTADDDTVIPIDLCESAKMREVESYGETIWGIDVARFGRDRTVLVKRSVNSTLEKHKAWSGNDTMQTSGRIYAEWLDTPPEKRPKAVFVDAIGIGAGVADRLMELGMPVTGVNVAEEASVSELYMRLRDELWFKARKWLEKKDCKLVDDETLIAELSLPKYQFTSSGKLKVESKDEMKKRYPQSPDCFVAGTMVSTPFGDVPIEQLSVGDMVSTPVGDRTVIKLWETETDSPTTVVFSNGTVLKGKGKHEVFTWDSGWVRLDALQLNNTIEFNNVTRRMLWEFQWLLHTKAKTSGFKRQVGITSQEGKLHRSDFFTGAYGATTLVKSLKTMLSITKTAIGQTIHLITFKSCQVPIMQGNILQRECLIQNSQRQHDLDSIKPVKPQKNGIPQRKDWSGTESMDWKHGEQESSLIAYAQNAQQYSSHIGIQQNSALYHAAKNTFTKKAKQALEYALYVAKSLFLTSTGLKPIVPVDVRSDHEIVKTYNITLDRDNVYYANGVLVANCADAFCMTFAHAIEHKTRGYYEPECFPDS